MLNLSIDTSDFSFVEIKVNEEEVTKIWESHIDGLILYLETLKEQNITIEVESPSDDDIKEAIVSQLQEELDADTIVSVLEGVA